MRPSRSKWFACLTKAFRPGQVDMPPEHLLGMLPDTLSEFELLLPDAVFAPRVQKASNDITLPDSFYPQYSQTANNLAENSQLLSNSNLLDNSIDDSIIQVGRDQEMARGVGEGDLQFGQGAIDFGFEKLYIMNKPGIFKKTL